MNNNFEKVKELILENLGCREEDISLETNLVEDLEADSLDIVELSIALEDEFEIEVADEELEKLKTVKDIIEYLERG